MAKKKEMVIGTETVKNKVHNVGKEKMQIEEEMWVETEKMVEIRLWKMDASI